MAVARAQTSRLAKACGCRVPCSCPTLYVRTPPLARMVSAFVDDWKRTRPPRTARCGGANGGGGRWEFVDAMAWLASETGLGIGTIERVRYSRSHTTPLDVADPLVAALGYPEAFHDGTLEVVETRGQALTGGLYQQ